MSDQKLKLPRLSEREHRILRIISFAYGEERRWLDPAGLVIHVYSLSVFTERAEIDHYLPVLLFELDALVKRRLLEKNAKGEYRITVYGSWAELVWDYVYSGALMSTAKRFFRLADPVPTDTFKFRAQITEADLAEHWDICDDDQAAYDEYLEELKAKGMREE